MFPSVHRLFNNGGLHCVVICSQKKNIPSEYLAGLGVGTWCDASGDFELQGIRIYDE